MTLHKLLRLLHAINDESSKANIKLRGSHIYCSGGGELSISFNTQPTKQLDSLLRAAGFIVWQCEYIYRPIVRRK